MSWDRKTICRRFFNCGHDAVAIVATVSLVNGELYDWSAYVGIGTPMNEQVCADQVAHTGNKLSRRDAAYFFPDLPGDKWRA